MNNGNFNAIELDIMDTILGTIKSAYNQLEHAGLGGSEVYGEYDIRNLVSSSDSELSNAWGTSKDTVEDISQKVERLIANLNEEFQKYMMSTIENEESTSNAIASINRALEEDIEMLEKIKM